MSRRRRTPDREPPDGDIPVCQHPDCQLPGRHRAPGDREGLVVYWFCLEHVRAYNAQWDFFRGMSRQQVENYHRDGSFGHRPTWRLGQRECGGPEAGMWVDPPDILRHSWTGTQHRGPARRRGAFHSPRRLSPEQLDALAVLGLDCDASRDEIRTRYRDLARKYHPDLNGDRHGGEEKLKQVNTAYEVLAALVTGPGTPAPFAGPSGRNGN